MEISDQQLVFKYLKGDEKALEILIKRYLKPIYSFTHRYVGNFQDAEDITQEVFIKVWRNLKKFDRKKSFKTWIFSIAKNACVDRLRKVSSGAKSAAPLYENIIDPSLLPNETFAQKSAAGAVNRAVNKLTPKYRLVLSSYYNDNFTFREISQALGEPLNTVKSRHRRALIYLKKLLSKN